MAIPVAAHALVQPFCALCYGAAYAFIGKITGIQQELVEIKP